MQLSTKTEEQLRIVSVHDDRIDAAVALEFKDAMRAQTEDCPNTVVLALCQVKFFDSSVLVAFFATTKTIGARRKMALAGLTPAFERVFKLTRMDTVFDIFSTLDGALEELRA